MKGGRGFTLVELLVAIGILAFVAVMGWRGLDGIMRSRVILTAQMEQTRGMQLAFAQMQTDCEHLAGSGTGSTLLHQRRNLAGDNKGLTLVRTVFGENQALQLQVVSYRIKDGVLTRRESSPTRDLAQLDILWQAALSGVDSTVTPVVLQTGVSGIVLRTWDGTGWSVLSNATGASLLSTVSGLEVALQLQGQETSLVKVFLLGAV
ncbi:MAG TPA: type II secretory pathway component PulJ [Janthinobacterium sp.]|nr:type II secretory pathway component PulJ [Janthinobacterium sp.]